MWLKKLFDTAKEFGSGFSERKIAMYAASSTYNIFMATAPVIMLMVSLIQFLPINENYILEHLAEWMPEQVMSVVQRIIIGIYSGGKTAFTVSVILTVFSVNPVFADNLRTDVNTCPHFNEIPLTILSSYCADIKRYV